MFCSFSRAVLAALPKSPTTLLVQFDEAVDPSSAGEATNYSITVKGGGATLAVSAATLAAGSSAVELTTDAQVKLADYTLTVKSIADAATARSADGTHSRKIEGWLKTKTMPWR